MMQNVYVYSVRAPGLPRLKVRLIRALAGRHADRVFGVSPEVARGLAAFGAIPRSKVAVVPNGIDTGRFLDDALIAEAAGVRRDLGIPESAPVVGTIGRLADVKRQDVLIRGFARLGDVVPEARLLIVGDGPLRPGLESLARSLGLGDWVVFAGYQARPERFLRAMDAFALTSRTEGMPLAILEAWASGVPVVASRIDAVLGLVEHGRTGLLFEPGDSEGLAGALGGLLGDPARSRRIARAARARALAEFDEDVMSAAYLGHYRDALDRGRALR